MSEPVEPEEPEVEIVRAITRVHHLAHRTMSWRRGRHERGFDAALAVAKDIILAHLGDKHVPRYQRPDIPEAADDDGAHGLPRTLLPDRPPDDEVEP